MCRHFQDGVCDILVNSHRQPLGCNCDRAKDCTFYQTEQEFQKSCKECREAFLALSKEKQFMYCNMYYGGINPYEEDSVNQEV